VKALSLWQPWATLIANGAKQIETRSWSTSYRGPILIHAAKRKVLKELKELAEDEDYCVALGVNEDQALAKLQELPYGAIVAIAVLADCKPVEQLQPSNNLGGEYWLGNYSSGRYGWILSNVRAITPIPYKGEQGLFDVPDVIARLT